MNPLKSGDKVIFNDDPARLEYIVYSIYSPTKVSLGLYDFPNIEQDWQVDISKLTKIGSTGVIEKLHEIEIFGDDIKVRQPTIKEIRAKINELVDAVNKLNKNEDA